MIIDLLTNSKDVVEFVKESEEFGGIIDKQPNAYVLLNIQIDLLDRFYERLSSFVNSKKIDFGKCGYRILDAKGIVTREEGNLSSDLILS